MHHTTLIDTFSRQLGRFPVVKIRRFRVWENSHSFRSIAIWFNNSLWLIWKLIGKIPCEPKIYINQVTQSSSLHCRRFSVWCYSIKLSNILTKAKYHNPFGKIPNWCKIFWERYPSSVTILKFVTIKFETENFGPNSYHLVLIQFDWGTSSFAPHLLNKSLH